MKLVINTQYRENYAAHDEGYVHGVSEPYWKFKGGTSYVVPNFTGTNGEATALVSRLSHLIEYSNPASEEYIIESEVVSNLDKHVPEWDTITEIFENEPGLFQTMRVTDNREDGWMRKEILEKTEAWTMGLGGEREDYVCSFLMEDGDIVFGQDELREWFEANEVN